MKKETLFEPFSHTPQATFETHDFIEDEFGCANFSKMHWILAFLGHCCECADFVITNGKKSRNQRLINFA